MGNNDSGWPFDMRTLAVRFMEWMMETRSDDAVCWCPMDQKKRKMFTNASMPLVAPFHFDVAHCANAIYHNVQLSKR